MDTPNVEGLSQSELFVNLAQVEETIKTIHYLRSQLNQEELAAQAHRQEIQRALGCIAIPVNTLPPQEVDAQIIPLRGEQ